ncbi:Replication factor A protein 1 [Coemansia asiatica]|uniref:Replication protein A subunit n=1 Tax=Coemansia asiatica TaxID=1052880 RepID=A0A9W7XKZ0_9FUNG|nr:Replication factor A protein 1 [Coemansia asiatica]
MSFELSAGEIARLNTIDGNCPISQPLVLQVISNIQPFGNQTPLRYRCMVSDGESTAIAVLSNTMIPLVDENKIMRYTVLRIKKGNSTKKERPNEPPMVFLIVMDADILETLSERIQSQGKGIGTAAGAGSSAGACASAGAGAGAPGQSFHQQQQHYQQQQPQQQHFQQQQQQQSSFMSRMEDTKPSFGASMAPIHTGAPPTVHPIVDLNPYHSKWTIRARVSQKSAIKSWNKPNSSGRLFSVNLLDESGEIRATTFTNQVDRFYPMLEMGKVYYVSNAQVKMARQQFSNVNNQYELTFDDSTVIELCQEQAGVPQEHFDFIPLASLSKFEKNHVVDVLAVVKSVGDLNEITPKSGGDKKMIKRDLVLVDKSGFQVRATLWGDDAQSFSAGSEPVVAFKGFRVGDFGGRSLSLASMGSYTVNPDIPEAHQLRGWYDASGRSLGYQSFGSMGGSSGDMSERNDAQLKTMAQVRVENLGGGANADYFTLKGTIVYIRTNNLSYPACPSEGCNRKVVEDSSTGQWGCEKCARSYPAPEYRYIFSINVSDETGQAWLQCFSEVGQLILGQSANTMKQYEADPASSSQFKKVIDDATFKEYKFRCKARTEQFNETSRVRISVVSAYPVDYVSETKRLSKLIDSFSQQ